MASKIYVFSGYATVSVTARVEADSLKQARSMLESGDCEWVCDEVDGDVKEIELVFEEEGELGDVDEADDANE